MSSWTTIGLLILLGAVVFGPLLPVPFIWDDKSLIRDSAVLASPSNLGSALRRDFWAMSANPREVGMYRPLVTASYFLDRAVFGLDPLGPHAVNLGLHVLVATLLGLLALRLGAEPREALFAVAIFAFHPATVEAVANVASRGDLLATGLALGALLCLRRPGARWLVIASALTALSQLAKESTFVLLPLALTLEWWTAGFSIDLRRWGAVSVALGTATLSTLALHIAVAGEGLTTRATLTGWAPVLSGATGVMHYARLVLWPTPLVPYQPALAPSVALAAGLILGLIGAALCVRRVPLVTASAAWFLCATVPVAGWLPLEIRFSGLLLYLPLTGLAIMTARGLMGVNALVRSAVPLAEALMAAALVPMWTSEETLWRTNVETWPELAAPRVNLANALSARGAPDARDAYEEAVAVARVSQDSKSLCLAEFGLGNHWLRSTPTEAEKHFASAREVSGGRMWQAGVNLAVALTLQHRLDEAAEVLDAQWSSTALSSVADAGLRLAQDRRDVEAIARWRLRVLQARANHQ